MEEYKSQQDSNSLNKININNHNLCDIKFHSSFEEHQNEKLFLIEADKVRISQVISNLLRNALKFTNEGDLINVTISTKDSGIKREVIVRISDTGSGIDPKIYPKLFTKFASKSDLGIGLGLFICKSIIKHMVVKSGLKTIQMEKVRHLVLAYLFKMFNPIILKQLVIT